MAGRTPEEIEELLGLDLDELEARYAAEARVDRYDPDDRFDRADAFGPLREDCL